MKIKFFCPRWGFKDIPWEIFLADVKAEGYSGIEWFPHGEKINSREVIELLQHHQLELAIVMTVTQPYKTFKAYLSSLKEQLFDLCSLSPLHISAQTGREYFTAPQIEACIECCRQVSKQTGIPVYQETHRNKWTYAAHVVHPFLEKYSDLMLTLDVSHWFCVSESYLEDQSSAVEKAIRHARHIHARVGHTEGMGSCGAGICRCLAGTFECLGQMDRNKEAGRSTSVHYHS